MKNLLLLTLTFPLMMQAQIFGPITEAPQHVIGFGVGGSTPMDAAVYAGFGEKLPGTAATYSYTSVSFLPSLVRLPSGGRSLSVSTSTHEGFKQIVWQSADSKVSLLLNAGAGASFPSGTDSAFTFSAAGGGELVWKFRPGFAAGFSVDGTQVAGGTVLSFGLSLLHW